MNILTNQPCTYTNIGTYPYVSPHYTSYIWVFTFINIYIDMLPTLYLYANTDIKHIHESVDQDVSVSIDNPQNTGIGWVEKFSTLLCTQTEKIHIK